MTSTRCPTALTITMLLGALAVLPACGSSSENPGTPQGRPPAGVKPAVAQHAPGAGSAVATAPQDPVTRGSKRSRVLPTPVEDKEAETGTPRRAASPCRLVKRVEAATIVGRAVASPRLAPLGPTCIYRTAKASMVVTLSVQQLDLGRSISRGPGVIRASVGGRPAYCVTRGGLRMLVPLAGGKVLTVGAPCPIAARFASRALVRVGR